MPVLGLPLTESQFLSGALSHLTGVAGEGCLRMDLSLTNDWHRVWVRKPRLGRIVLRVLKVSLISASVPAVADRTSNVTLILVRLWVSRIYFSRSVLDLLFILGLLELDNSECVWQSFFLIILLRASQPKASLKVLGIFLYWLLVGSWTSQNYPLGLLLVFPYFLFLHLFVLYPGIVLVFSTHLLLTKLF